MQETQVYLDEQRPTDYLNQTIQYGPPCFLKVLMFPVPFFSIGCCLAKTTILLFNKQAKTLQIEQYSGLCIPCGTINRIPFGEIRKLGYKRTAAVKNRKKPYVMTLYTKTGQFELTGPKIANQCEQMMKQLSAMMKRSRIEFELQAVE